MKEKLISYIFKWQSVMVVTLLLFYFLCVNHVEPNEVGISWNPFIGEAKCESPGFYISPPWTRVSNIDTRPCRVCITSTANSYNCLLVAFDAKYFAQFVKIQGFSYWWWNNRFSFNSGYGTEYRGFRDILRGYAYGNVRYDFIKIVETDYSNTTAR